MNLQEILEHRRAVRYYDASKPIDADRVEACVRLATLAPTSSNMQLWEAYHVTDRATIDRLVPACMGQSAVKTAQQLVVFVVRPDLWKDHAEKVLNGAVENIRKTYPQEKWEKYVGLQQAYYRKICPFLYSRGFGVWGLCRKLISCVVGCFRPMPREVTESARAHRVVTIRNGRIVSDRRAGEGAPLTDAAGDPPAAPGPGAPIASSGAGAPALINADHLWADRVAHTYRPHYWRKR